MARQTTLGSPDRPRLQPSGRPLPDHNDALLTTPEAAHLLGLSPRTLESLRLRGGGPVFIAVTAKAVRYRRRDLEDLILTRRRTSTSDPGHSSNTGQAANCPLSFARHGTYGDNRGTSAASCI